MVLGHPVVDDGEPGFLCMFWNVENFFAGKAHFGDKCNGIAKTVFMAADYYGSMPDIIGLAEVENATVLKSLLYRTGLRKMDYSIVHFDSPDRRGIDCALLYRHSRFRLLLSKPCHLTDSTGRILPTRDILLAVLEPLPVTATDAPWPSASGKGPPRDPQGADGDGIARPKASSVAVLVNHHPSKIGRDSDSRRRIAMDRLLYLRDSLLSEGFSHIVAIGDFNDKVTPAPGVEAAYPAAAGTIKFQGKWEKIDGCPVLEGLCAREHIFSPPCLSVPDRKHTGVKPLRTWSGPRWLGGVSDHYPIILELSPL